jgi:hypothetical protein
MEVTLLDLLEDRLRLELTEDIDRAVKFSKYIEEEKDDNKILDSRNEDF